VRPTSGLRGKDTGHPLGLCGQHPACAAKILAILSACAAKILAILSACAANILPTSGQHPALSNPVRGVGTPHHA